MMHGELVFKAEPSAGTAGLFRKGPSGDVREADLQMNGSASIGRLCISLA